MTAEKRAAIKKFVDAWKERGDEKQDTQSFWLSLLRNVYDVDNPASYIQFEKQVQLSHQSYIDGYIPTTKVLIEQKSADVDLRKGQRQSDGSMLSPFGQARRYAGYLPHDEHPKWIVVCNFHEFQIHDMNRPNDEPQIVKLADLEKEYHRMNFLVDTGDENTKRELEISMDAGRIVGELYDALLAQYNNPDDPETLKSLNMLCVRLVFCLYAEDAGVFGVHGMFHDYLKGHAVKDVRRALIDLFAVLNTKPEDRDPYMDEVLLAFPYVNGGLFADSHVVIPRLDEHIVDLILQRASADFDWSEISPTIFGAVFESTLNPETRRSGGMHYTSIENIHKVIDPLFLDDLRAELAEIQEITVTKTRKQKLRVFQDKLAQLTFLDPACGSGNFLTETYLSLRRLENEVLRSLSDQISLFGDSKNPIKVSINQFYGIEINDFAVTVAKAALWIAESQMMKETMDIIHNDLDYLPLETQGNIVEGNALRLNWETVVPNHKLDYIMGNPPFVGARLMNAEQKNDVKKTFAGWKNIGNLDYVSCWYKKAADYMHGTKIRTALVSTNSITQGESVSLLWKPLFEASIHIDFAHQTFRWDSEATDKAHVHCVIVGFSEAPNNKPRIIFTDQAAQIAKNINGYLLDAPNFCVESRKKPLCNVPEIGMGNQPIDDGNYLFTKEEMEEFIKLEPASKPYFEPWYGAKEFINQAPRYCLWLGDCPISALRKMPECRKRVEAVREYRLSSKRKSTKKLADKPTRFQTENMPNSNYIVIPEVSSERRRYIPIGFMPPDVLCSNKLRLMPNATLYHFGILTSNVHNAWMRTVCCRLETRYSYSINIVYNNFPWPEPTEAQRAKIAKTAQAILDARDNHPQESLADLYDETFMPADLRKAHQDNDRAVMEAYGLNKNSPEFKSESACVAMLMKMYQNLTEKS